MRRALATLTSTALTAAALVVITALPASAATLVVNPSDGSCTTVGPIYCAANYAINAAVSGDTIQLAAGIHPAGSWNYVIDTVIGGAKNLTFVGAGVGVTILDGEDIGGGIRLQGPATYSISDLTIIDGFTTGDGITTGLGGGIRVGINVTVTVENVEISGATSSASGGGMYLGTGSVVNLDTVEIKLSNTTTGAGGGIFVSSGATVTLVDSVIDDNDAATTGGGISAVGENITIGITTSTISNNTAVGAGGGIRIDTQTSGGLTITDSEVFGNTSTTTVGGGLAISRGTHIVQRSLFLGNTAGTGETDHGGGIHYSEPAGGANLLTVTNSTFSANTAGEDGGGIYGHAVVASSTFTLNHATGRGGGVALARIRNTIVAGNTDLDPSTYQECYLAVTDGYNVIGTASETCLTLVDATSTYSADASLAALASNGGPTRTHALQPASDAINAGNPATPGSTDLACPTIDQRGEPRALHRCDAGAFEEDISGTISGTVLSDGSPAVAVDVVLYTEAGHLIDSTTTNGSGDYTLDTAGVEDYILRFAATSPQFMVQWWNDRPTLDSADPIALANYQVVANYDADLVRVPTVGLFNPAQGQWHLRNASGVVTSFYFGNPGDSPIMGDWDCDGIDTVGMYRQSNGMVYLRNTNDVGAHDIRFFFGNPGDLPIVGDFDNDGCDTVSIYRPTNQTFYIINELGVNDGGLGAAEFSYVFGNPGDKPFTGDFDGDGTDTVGLHRESSGFVYFRNSHTQGNADAQFFFGNPNDRFVTGAWIGTGIDSPAVFRPGNTTFYFRHTNTQGPADNQFVWGSSGWLPISGHFGLD